MWTLLKLHLNIFTCSLNVSLQERLVPFLLHSTTTWQDGSDWGVRTLQCEVYYKVSITRILWAWVTKCKLYGVKSLFFFNFDVGLFSCNEPFSVSIVFPPSLSALSSYLRLTAPAPESSTNWCPQVSRPWPQSPRRSAPFLPRGSAPSARAPTAWLTATRSETGNLWEEVKGRSPSVLVLTKSFSNVHPLRCISDHVRVDLSTLSHQVNLSTCLFVN